MADSWDVCLEDAFDVVECLDEIAEERDYPPAIRLELMDIYKSLNFIREYKNEAS